MRSTGVGPVRPPSSQPFATVVTSVRVRGCGGEAADGHDGTGTRMGTDEVLTELARTRGSALVGYAYLLTGDRAAAEDLVQEAFVRVFSRRRTGEVERWEPYVRSTVLRVYLDGRRRDERRRGWRHLSHGSEHAPDAAEVVVQDADIARALAVLTPRERACVVLRLHDDLTIVEIADRLGLATGTVKRYLHDAAARLAPLVGPDAVPHDDVPTVPTTERGARR